VRTRGCKLPGMLPCRCFKGCCRPQLPAVPGYPAFARCEAQWDSQLSETMAKIGVAVAEEAIAQLDALAVLAGSRWQAQLCRLATKACFNSVLQARRKTRRTVDIIYIVD